MFYLYFLLQKINYKIFFWYIIPISSIILATIYNTVHEIDLTSADAIQRVATVCFSPYIIGISWLGLYIAYKNNGGNSAPSLSPKYRSITNVLDFEKLSFKNYSRCVFWAWGAQTGYWVLDLLN
ncbi:MAG: hypothetical protein MI866_09105 [Bacteroidales bacterium]|nr:hypothetical protein [Bacteroidales bacterium]